MLQVDRRYSDGNSEDGDFVGDELTPFGIMGNCGHEDDNEYSVRIP